MANYRQIHVSLWKDEWFLDLSPEEKLLFIYLFSNESTSLAGIYKLAIKVICFETGLDIDFVHNALDKFTKQGKVYYENGVVWVVNMRRYHETSSSKVQTRIKNDIDEIPDCPLKIAYLENVNTLSIPYPYPNLKEEEEDKDKDKDKNGDGLLFSVYEQEIGPLTPTIADTIKEFEKDNSQAYIVEAIKIAAKNNKRNINYVRGILRKWQAEGKTEIPKTQKFVEWS